MDNFEKGFEILQDTILNNKTHRDYARVTSLAKEYYDIFSGAGIDAHLRNIVKRESEELFKQRKALYHSTIPSTVNKMLVYFNKVARSNRVFSTVTHSNAKAQSEILDRIVNFWQGESESGLDAYLRQQWLHLCTYDPNAYIAVEIADFNPQLEKTYPFPYIFSSDQVRNFQYLNGKLDWLIAAVPCDILTDTKGSKRNNGLKWYMYLDNQAIVLTEIDKLKRIVPENLSGEIIEIRDRNNNVHSVYVLQVFDTKAQSVPLIRAGYKLDPVTKNRTAVSILHPALAYFHKELKTGSEFDLTMSLHVFPQKIQFGVPCPGEEESGSCHNGQGINGGICKRCSGSGVIPIHTSSQDILEVKMPANGEDLPDLNKFLVYKHPPIDLIKFQNEFLENLTQKAIRAVFNIEDLSQSIKTATEIEYSEDNVQDTLFECAQMYSTVWKFIVRKIAIYTDNSEGVEIYHQFAKDLKLKSISQLMVEAKNAKDSGLSHHAIAAINNDILEAYYADDQDTLNKLKIKNRFQPFDGKSESEIQNILMGEDLLPYYKYLYIYFNSIFNEIDAEYGDNFYLMQYSKQKEIVRQYVDALIEQHQPADIRIPIVDEGEETEL